MAQPPTPQIPQHVSALLSHLTSRPGVQSTLILSRKDGSIIQRTGLLAQSTGSSQQRANSVPTIENSTPATTVALDPAASPTNSQDLSQSISANYTSSTNQTQPYKPSQAEALAAHIYAFVSSASALSRSLSDPTSSTGPEPSYVTRSATVNGTDENPPSTGVRQDDAEGDSREREAEDEVKLLRLRTKRHEIVVVPDRKYLLCVVHDASGAASSSSGGGAASTR